MGALIVKVDRECEAIVESEMQSCFCQSQVEKHRGRVGLIQQQKHEEEKKHNKMRKKKSNRGSQQEEVQCGEGTVDGGVVQELVRRISTRRGREEGGRTGLARMHGGAHEMVYYR